MKEHSENEEVVGRFSQFSRALTTIMERTNTNEERSEYTSAIDKKMSATTANFKYYTTLFEQTEDEESAEQTTTAYGNDALQLPQWWMDLTPHDNCVVDEAHDGADKKSKRRRQRKQRPQQRQRQQKHKQKEPQEREEKATDNDDDYDIDFVRRMYADEFVQMYADLSSKKESGTAKDMLADAALLGTVGKDHIDAAKDLFLKRNELLKVQYEIDLLEKELILAEVSSKEFCASDDVSRSTYSGEKGSYHAREQRQEETNIERDGDETRLGAQRHDNLLEDDRNLLVGSRLGAILLTNRRSMSYQQIESNVRDEEESTVSNSRRGEELIQQHLSPTKARFSASKKWKKKSSRFAEAIDQQPLLQQQEEGNESRSPEDETTRYWVSEADDESPSERPSSSWRVNPCRCFVPMSDSIIL